MKNRLAIFSTLLICIIFSNTHAFSGCKAITLLMTYEETAKALNGKIENCTVISKKLDKEQGNKETGNPYYDSIHYGSPDCGDPMLMFEFSHGYLSSLEDDSAVILKDGTHFIPTHVKPCLSEDVIQLGMTYQQIAKVLKKEGTVESKPHINSDGIYMAEYMWDVEALGSVLIGFQNNKATTIDLQN